ncbi:hypothetical protein AB0D65_14010 [Streptomyces griseoloalbus]|uniref:Uncharacterized protein n=1 Tax=Streptomyces griseoloalbus TaxID=67303 RepID=A0ABV3E4P8_9ACTN
MTDGTGKGPDALSECLEDAFVEDIGLSWVTSKWNVPDELSPEDAERFLPDGGPSAWWLTLPASAVENFDRSRAVRLGQDIRALVESPLPDGTIRTVWLGATHGTSDPEAYGFGARAWLRALEDAWLIRVREEDPAFTPPRAQPVLDEGARQAVLGVIRPVAGDLGRAASDPGYGLPVRGLVPALRQVVTEACADLGYRLFLRALKAYFVEIDTSSHDAFVALGQRFGYPEFLVEDNLNHRH